jgi:hypothetical protein
VPGTVLTATFQSEAPFKPTYVWQSSTGGPWSAIAGATASTYVATAADAGTDIRVVVSAKFAGYATSVAISDSVEAPILGQIGSRVDPTVGLPAVDAADTADVGVWNVSGLTFAYQWYLDGIAIPGATGATFTPIASQATQDLSVRVTASKTGYLPASATSDEEPIALGAAAVATVAPKAVGTSSACTSFAVTPGTWSIAGITETYQWAVDGSPVGKATATTFTPGQPDHLVAVAITVTSPGHATAVTTVLVTAVCKFLP